MARDLTTGVAAATESSAVILALFWDVTFADNVYHFWSGIGFITWNGNTYTGVATQGEMSATSEGIAVEANGIQLKLSGLDPTWLNESMNEINAASRAVVWLAFFASGAAIIADPVCLYSGIMDAPAIDLDTNTFSITIDVENKFIEMNRSRGGRLTDQDQRSRYPNDASLSYVALNQDRNLIWNA